MTSSVIIVLNSVTNTHFKIFMEAFKNLCIACVWYMDLCLFIKYIIMKISVFLFLYKIYSSTEGFKHVGLNGRFRFTEWMGNSIPQLVTHSEQRNIW